MAMNRGMVAFYKEQYPAGTRICLDRMGDDPNPLPSEAKGTVSFVDDTGTVFANFDCGRMLGVCLEVDSFHKISEQTESQEPKMSM